MSYLQKDLIRAALAELADEKFQTLAWTNGIPGEIHSFEECVDMLFTDSGLADSLEAGDVYSPAIDSRLRTLQRLLSQIDPFRSVEMVLNDAKLPKVRELATKLTLDLGETEIGG